MVLKLSPLKTPGIDVEVERRLPDSDTTIFELENTGSVNGIPVSGGGGDTSSLIAKNTLQAKGDLISATGASAPQRLAVGLNGQVPVARSAASVGIQWENQKVMGFEYLWSTNTSATDPTSGKLKLNHATISSATALYISETDANSNAIAAEIATWDDSTSTIRGRILIQKATDPTKFALFNLTGTNTDNGSWDTLTITHVASAGSFSADDNIVIYFVPKGDKGQDGSFSGRTNVVVTTASLANLAEETGTVALGKTFILIKLSVDKSCRVRLYTNVAKRTADSSRLFGTDPTAGTEHGVICDVLLTAGTGLAWLMSPEALGSNNESSITTAIPYAIQNLSGSTGTVEVTFTVTAMET